MLSIDILLPSSLCKTSHPKLVISYTWLCRYATQGIWPSQCWRKTPPGWDWNVAVRLTEQVGECPWAEKGVTPPQMVLADWREFTKNLLSVREAQGSIATVILYLTKLTHAIVSTKLWTPQSLSFKFPQKVQNSRRLTLSSRLVGPC